MLTAKQRELLLFIDGRLRESGISPSFDEMREALDLKSKSGVHRLISALEERGFIRRLPNRARALDIIKLPETRPAATVTPLRPAAAAPANDTIDIPLHGRIAAGTPIEALQGPRISRFPPRCSARASIMRSRCRAIRWSRKAFSTAISR